MATVKPCLLFAAGYEYQAALLCSFTADSHFPPSSPPAAGGAERECRGCTRFDLAGVKVRQKTRIFAMLELNIRRWPSLATVKAAITVGERPSLELSGIV